MAIYTIPPGNRVPFPFSSDTPYTPPPGNKVALRFGGAPGSVFAAGFDATLFGVASIQNTTAQLFASGWDSAIVSGNLVVTKSLLASGFTSMAFGQPSVRNNTTIVTPTGFSATLFGTAWASFYTRYLSPGGIGEGGYGTATLSGGVRNAQMNGFATAVYGTPSITFQLRQLFPQWWVDTFYGKPTMGFRRELAPSGFDSLVMGDQVVHDNRIHADMTGFDASAFGTGVTVYNYTRTLVVKPFVDSDITNIGFPHIVNVTQYITTFYRSTEWIEGGVADPLSTNVRNVNRVVDLVGNGIAPLFRQVPEGAEVANGARLVQPPGGDLTLWGSGTFIEPRIRAVFPQGFEPAELSSRFHVVRNAAFQILPGGFDASSVGTPPLVVNTRRSFYVGGLGDTSLFGRPFIAPGVRTIGPQNQLEPVGGLIGGATVWYRVRNITPTPPDFPLNAFGIATLDIRINKIAAKSIPPIEAYGQPTVRNNTPQLYPYWDADSFTRFGATRVFNKLNYFPMQGDDVSAFGFTVVDYRTITVKPPGLDAARMNLLHKVQKVTPDPPAAQYVFPGSPDTSLFGTPYLTNNGLYPDGIASSEFGSPVVDNRGIFPVGIAPPIDDGSGTQFGKPSLPGRQVASVEGIDSSAFGKPLLNPLTIWAPTGAPQQAVANHNGISGTTIDFFLTNNDIRPVFGNATVESTIRYVRVASSQASLNMGVPAIGLKLQYVLTTGLNALKSGFPELSGGDHEVNFYGFDLSSYGNTTLAHVEPRNRALSAIGFATQGFGTTVVSNFIRSMPVPGLNATLFGGTIVQRPPPPAEPDGLDATLFGTAMIDFRIRYLHPSGWDSFVCDYTLGQFNDRMRVTTTTGTSTTVTAGDLLLMGAPRLEHSDKGISVPSIVDGAYGRPGLRRINRVDLVSAGRFDAFGDTWALPALEGTVQPRGDDFTGFGMAALARDIQVPGLLGQFGAIRLARPVGAQGFDPAQFGQVVAMGFGCGRQARVMRGWDSASFGAASVGSV